MEEKIPEEVTPTETPTEEPQADKLVEENATLKEQLNNVVEEIKSMRVSNRELKEENVELSKPKEVTPETKDPDTEKVSAVVKAVLEEEKASRAKSNQVTALEKFIAEHKEFTVDNDPTGLKRDALVRKLKIFNTQGLESTEDFYSVIEDANRLLGNVDTKPKTDDVIDTSTPTPDQTPNTVVSKVLTPQEKKLIDRIGWTEDKFLKTKAKRPDYVADLVAEIRN